MAGDHHHHSIPDKGLVWRRHALFCFASSRDRHFLASVVILDLLELFDSTGLQCALRQSHGFQKGASIASETPHQCVLRGCLSHPTPPQPLSCWKYSCMPCSVVSSLCHNVEIDLHMLIRLHFTLSLCCVICTSVKVPCSIWFRAVSSPGSRLGGNGLETL